MTFKTMKELKFNSQVCTTIEQSKRLLELGLKPETADMYYFWLDETDYRLNVDVDNNPLKYKMDKTYIPAWSLHKLIELYTYKNCALYYMIRTPHSFDGVINDIAKRIENGYFNKEYLKEN